MKTVWIALLCSIVLSAQAADEVRPGLIAEYYEFDTDVSDFPKITDEKKPSIRRVEKQVFVENCESNFNNTNIDKNFYARWTGSLKIDKPGNYVFFLESDDGSRLYIDGKLIVDNPGSHPMEKKQGAATLAPGQHDIKIEFFQGNGGMGCKFSWVQPGKNEEPLNETTLSHKADAE